MDRAGRATPDRPTTPGPAHRHRAIEEAGGGTEEPPVAIRADVDHGAAELVSDPGRPQAWTLLLDGTAQSHVDLADPEHLEFEYVRRIAHVADLVAEPGRPLRALHLGGGAWTLARYLAATRPGSEQLVVELDGALIDLVAHRLPGPGPADGLRVRAGEARTTLAGLGPRSWDLVVLDAFAGARTPAQVTTAEFLDGVRRALAPGGTYVANLGDGAPWPFLPGQIATAGAAFAHLALLAAPDVLRGRRFGNLVLTARDEGTGPLPIPALIRRAAADPFPARVLDDAGTRQLAGDAAVVTDRTATPSPRPPPGLWGQ